jgi:acyl-coenzyme A thioesterase PaaI-like protein
MFNTDQVVKKAQSSGFYRWVLNVFLNRLIPFNQPHGFSVIEIEDYRIKTLLPYKRRNFNHIKGLHACALATLSEFTTGFLLISRLDMKRYRLILQRLEMDYLYQGKMSATAEFTISEEWLKEKVYEPLAKQEAIVIPCEVKIHDSKGNHLTTGKVFWQIKDWNKVKTKT